ncbi:hypothetical protein [Sphingosinicella terrae]|uniref:hypothetical protein n=1 Tax=Sphingosinicella terrae TaxID=2172047 RepID=UPI0025497E9C|nr:hypothetical protein [Sphingosinicella terrae]
MKAAIALFAPCLLSACAATTASNGIEGPVGLGEIAYVDGPRVRPDRLVEDSRCPIDAQCVWAGRVVLRATVIGGSWSRPVDLILGEPVQVADGMLTLVAVAPERRSEAAVRPEQLRFTFAFQGGL